MYVLKINSLAKQEVWATDIGAVQVGWLAPPSNAASFTVTLCRIPLAVDACPGNMALGSLGVWWQVQTLFFLSSFELFHSNDVTDTNSWGYILEVVFISPTATFCDSCED